MDEFLIDGKSVQQQLLDLSKAGNKPFTQSLHPGIENVLGLRIPDLRKLAKRIAKSDWQHYLCHAGTYYMEERTLQGLVLGYVPVDDLDVYLQWVDRFVRIINSWSVCDTFTFSGGKKLIRTFPDELWSYVKGWMMAGGEYEIRFGVVMALRYFIDDKYLGELFALFNQIRHDGYYVKMAIAWAVSVCFVYYPERTMEFLRHNQLDDFTYNKSLQKIVESFRVDDEMKQLIKGMRR